MVRRFSVAMIGSLLVRSWAARWEPIFGSKGVWRGKRLVAQVVHAVHVVASDPVPGSTVSQFQAGSSRVPCDAASVQSVQFHGESGTCLIILIDKKTRQYGLQS